MDEEIKDEELTPEDLQLEEGEEVAEAEEAATDEVAEGEEVAEEVAEEAPAVDDIAEIKETLAALIEKVDNGFSALNALFVDAGAVVRDYEPEDDKEEFVELEDLDFSI